MKKKEKTNVMRVLDSKKIKYNEYYYGDTEAVSGVDVAKALGQNPENVFKTLVTTGKSGEHYVFMVPVALCISVLFLEVNMLSAGFFSISKKLTYSSYV